MDSEWGNRECLRVNGILYKTNQNTRPLRPCNCLGLTVCKEFVHRSQGYGIYRGCEAGGFRNLKNGAVQEGSSHAPERSMRAHALDPAKLQWSTIGPMNFLLSK